MEQYDQTNDVRLLDEAVKLGREALDLRPSGHPKRARSCSSVASCLWERFRQTGDASVLTQAIELQHEALGLNPQGHPDRVMASGNMHFALMSRYTLTRDLSVLDELTSIAQETLASCHIGHLDRAQACSRLAVCFLMRNEHHAVTRDIRVNLINNAILLLRKALDLPDTERGQVKYRGNLAVCLIRLYNLTKDAAHLDEASGLCHTALQHCPPDIAWRLFQTLAILHLMPGAPHISSSAVLEAVTYMQQCCGKSVDDLHEFMPHFNDFSSLLWPLQKLWTSDITERVLDVYFDLIDRLPLRAGFILDTRARLQSLRSSSELGPSACVVSLHAQQPARAMEILDHAHGVVWAQALHQRNPELEGVPSGLATELEQLIRAIAAPLSVDDNRSTSLSSPHLTKHDVRHQQNSRIQLILQQIWAMPGLERFMLGNTFEMLREAARTHPVVVLVAAHGTVVALIMADSVQEQPDVLYLDLKWDDLQSFANSVGPGKLRNRGVSQELRARAIGDDTTTFDVSVARKPLMRPGNHPTRQAPLAKLWFDAVKPVLNRLGLRKPEHASCRPRVHWCTTGDFASLPVHAARVYVGPDQECCFDYVVSSYTPTLTSLLRAQRDLQPVSIANAKLLLVAAESTAYKRMRPLPSIKSEVTEIRAIAGRTNVQSASTAEHATARLPSATLVHIACHGTQDSNEPLKSAFHLGDNDTLPVSDLMELHLKGAYLAFLSACETAKGDRDQPDQAIHLAATMLFVGFKSVVATMWAMRDEDGPFIAQAFYKQLFEGDTISADGIAYALDHAVRKLKGRLGAGSVDRWATFIHVGA